MRIRETQEKDLVFIDAIFNSARDFMRLNGNPQQWNQNYPTAKDVAQDIKCKRAFVCVNDEDTPVGTFALFDHEPAYDHIDGKWMSDTSYKAVHRIATVREGKIGSFIIKYLERREDLMIKAIRTTKFTPMKYFKETKELSSGVLSHGTKMGEGWLLTAEMMELVEIGYGNIVCAQPFGCLPNHICGKGVMKKIKEIHPDANIVAIDYDPSATRVNQENRIKLMLAIAKEKIDPNEPAKL